MTMEMTTAQAVQTMNHLPMAGATLTMSSREIAELLEKRHDKVKQSIERLVERGVIARPPLGDVQEDGGNSRLYVTQVYHLDKRSSYIVVAQLSPEFTARVVDRWQELEEASNKPVTIDDLLQNPTQLLELTKGYALRIEEQQRQIAGMQDDVNELARIAKADGSLCITDAAKTLQSRPKDLFSFLREHRWIYDRPGSSFIAYQTKLASGLLEHKTTTVHRSDGSEKVTTQVRITPKGLTHLAKVFQPNLSEV